MKCLQTNSIFYCIFLFLLIIMGCEKDEPDITKYKVSGRLINFTNGDRFPERKLMFRHTSSSFLYKVDSVLGYADTDEEGLFSFEYEMESGASSPALRIILDTSIGFQSLFESLPLKSNWYREFNVSTMSGLVLHFSRPLAVNEKLVWRYGYLYEIIGPRPAGFQSLIKIPNRTYSPTLFYGVDSIRSVNPQSVPYYPKGDPKVDTVFLAF